MFRLTTLRLVFLPAPQGQSELDAHELSNNVTYSTRTRRVGFLRSKKTWAPRNWTERTVYSFTDSWILS